MKSTLSLFTVMVSFLMHTACSSVPMTSLWKMSKLNPIEMNPVGVSIAVVTHKAVRFANDSAYIQMTYKTNSPATSIDEKFRVQINDATQTLSDSEKELLSNYKSADEAINTFSLSRQDAQAMRVLQRKVKALKQNKVDGKGSLSVGVDKICLSDSSVKTVEADIFARFNEKEGYILLIPGVDLLKTMVKNGVEKQSMLCK